MLIKEVCIECGLTKKAVEYYIEQGLIQPSLMENGYRDFNENETEQLKKIAVLRKLSLSIEEIKTILSSLDSDFLQKVSHQRGMEIEREKTKQILLERLSKNRNFEEIRVELARIEQGEIIAEKLLNTFPGYYGRFVSLHFSSFLNEPIKTAPQQEAFKAVIEFLDNVKSLTFSADLKKYIDENTEHLNTQAICNMIATVKESIYNPQQFIEDNKEVIECYIAYRASNDFRESLAYELMTLMREFGNTSGYYSTFIPAMRKLSSSYNDYQKQMEIANKKMIEQYPEVQEWATSR